MVISIERRGREDDVDAVIKGIKKLFRQAPKKRENSKSLLAQAFAQR
jgi:protein involved in ribonucleotide reduction